MPLWAPPIFFNGARFRIRPGRVARHGNPPLEDYEEATEPDNASAQVEAKALPKPKVTLPSDNPDAEYDKQTVLVAPVEGVGMAEVADAMGVDVSAMTDAGMGYYSVALPDETSAQEALEALQETTGIAAAQPDFVYYMLGDEDGSEPSSEENVDASMESGSSSAEGAGSQSSSASSNTATDDSTAADAEINETPYEVESVDEASVEADSTIAEEADPAVSEDALPKATEEQEEAVEAFGRTNDTNASLQWSLTSINAYDAWSILDESITHRVTVAVIDGGVESSHPDLVGNLMYDADGEVIGYNAIEESNDVSEVFETAEIYGHGTHAAGIIAASANNAKGVAGVSYNQTLYPVKVFDNTGRSTTKKLLNAYQHVLENKNTYGIRVVNMSVGTSLRDTAMKEAIDQAYAAGVVSVAAAGNDGEPATCYPCDFENVVGVINVRQDSTTSDGVSRSEASSYNNEGEQLKNISAPGAHIYSTYPSGSYQYMSGTSMAAPCVSGVLAMMFAVNPSLSAEQAINTLYATAHDLQSKGFDAETGWGEVDAKAAVQAAKATVGAMYFEDLNSDYTVDERAVFFSNIAATTVSNIATQYYTGSPIKPGVTVTSLMGKKAHRRSRLRTDLCR